MLFANNIFKFCAKMVGIFNYLVLLKLDVKNIRRKLRISSDILTNIFSKCQTNSEVFASIVRQIWRIFVSPVFSLIQKV
ncbi:hypothetical protein B6D60_03270 [candidate division KSB1 bacterium 4484_87]|nr:MAG: hypothetical protein B6D60_03270 [candidate division KSB1 bacterium 4484_87]